MRTLLARLSRLGAVAAVIAGLGLATAGMASASPEINVSFYSQGGASSNWAPQHSAVDMTLTTPTSYTLVEFHHVPTAAPAPSDAPTITAPQYQSGSPRFYIQLDNGAYLFGYPDGTWNVEGVPGVSGGLPMTYAEAYAASGAATAQVTSVNIVADASQQVPVTDVVTATYGSYRLGG